MMYAGGGFPWGLLIVGGIVFFLWRNGMFGGPRRFGPGGRYGGYGPGPGPGAGYGPPQTPEASGFGPGRGPGQGSDFGFRGPRDVFEEWHREAHETGGAHPQPQAPQAPAAPPAAPASAPDAPAREHEGPVVNA